ncbi:MAG TPA: hypothetical protein VFY49_15370 [Myxococcota bacterium]|nr:hypothetical protein [Myxococcota bacterium]
MSAAQVVSVQFLNKETRMTTLLELVRAISEVTDDEREVVATVLHMLASGQARLCGNFRGSSVEDFR